MRDREEESHCAIAADDGAIPASDDRSGLWRGSEYYSHRLLRRGHSLVWGSQGGATGKPRQGDRGTGDVGGRRLRVPGCLSGLAAAVFSSSNVDRAPRCFRIDTELIPAILYLVSWPAAQGVIAPSSTAMCDVCRCSVT